MIRAFVIAAAISVLSGCMTVQPASTLRAAPQRTFVASLERVQDESVDTLMSLGWQVTSSSRGDHLIQAITPATLWTAGDLVTIHLVPLESAVRVDMSSASRQQFDWGKNAENIERFYAGLTQRLSH